MEGNIYAKNCELSWIDVTNDFELQSYWLAVFFSFSGKFNPHFGKVQLNPQISTQQRWRKWSVRYHREQRFSTKDSDNEKYIARWLCREIPGRLVVQILLVVKPKRSLFWQQPLLLCRWCNQLERMEKSPFILSKTGRLPNNTQVKKQPLLQGPPPNTHTLFTLIKHTGLDCIYDHSLFVEYEFQCTQLRWLRIKNIYNQL